MFSETISYDTLRLIEKIRNRAWLSDYYLAGGTALALHLGHRTSADLDFFSESNIEGIAMVDHLRMAGDFRLVRLDEGTVVGNLDGVRISFFRYAYKLLDPWADWNGIHVASVRDISLMKIVAVLQRGSVKDFIDLFFVAKKLMSIDTLIQELPNKYVGVQFSTNHILRSLCYFDDADKEPMPNMISACSRQEVKDYFVKEVERLSNIL